MLPKQRFMPPQTTSATMSRSGVHQTPAPELSQGFWTRVWRQFERNYLAVMGLCVVLGLVVTALSADFLANDKPLYLVYKGQTYFPVQYNYWSISD